MVYVVHEVCSLLNVFETYKTYAAHCVVHEIVHLLLFQTLQVGKLCLHHVGAALFSQDDNRTTHSRNKTYFTSLGGTAFNPFHPFPRWHPKGVLCPAGKG